MALGINTFTTQEALNYDAYNEWNYEELDLGTALAGYKSSSYTISDSTSLAAEAMDGSETGFDVDDGDDFSAGDILLVNAELMYVSSIATNTLTVIRGYGTSTAASHANNTIIWKVGTPSNHGTNSSVNPIMKLGVDQLPFTLSGITITRLNMWNAGADGGADNDISILSFH